MSVRRMFLAGVKCPGCDLEDKLQICLDNDPEAERAEWVECVRCGYTDVRPKEVTMKEPDEHHPDDLSDAGGVVRFKP